MPGKKQSKVVKASKQKLRKVLDDLSLVDIRDWLKAKGMKGYSNKNKNVCIAAIIEKHQDEPLESFDKNSDKYALKPSDALPKPTLSPEAQAAATATRFAVESSDTETEEPQTKDPEPPETSTTTTSTKTFPCDFPGCHRSFGTKTGLSAHKKSHENQQNKKAAEELIPTKEALVKTTALAIKRGKKSQAVPAYADDDPDKPKITSEEEDPMFINADGTPMIFKSTDSSHTNLTNVNAALGREVNDALVLLQDKKDLKPEDVGAEARKQKIVSKVLKAEIKHGKTSVNAEFMVPHKANFKVDGIRMVDNENALNVNIPAIHAFVVENLKDIPRGPAYDKAYDKLFKSEVKKRVIDIKTTIKDFLKRSMTTKLNPTVMSQKDLLEKLNKIKV